MACGFSSWIVGFSWWVLFISRVLCERSLEGTIAFATPGRMHFAFDIFCVNVPSNWSSPENHGLSLAETRLTDGDEQSVNYNGFFAGNSEQDLIFKEKEKHATISYGASQGNGALEGKILAYVSEWQGRPRVYFNLYISKVEKRVYSSKVEDGGFLSESRTHGQASNVFEHKIETVELYTFDGDGVDGVHHDDDDDDDDVLQQLFLQDRPSIAQGCVIYISTQQKAPSLRQSWTAVYSTNLSTGYTTRLTPTGLADYSPSVSPSGEWVLVASYGERSWQGEVHEFNTDLYIFNAKDGSQRKLLVQGAGWPSWADSSTFFFHREAEDGWWSIYKGTISTLDWMSLKSQSVINSGLNSMEDLVAVERVTPAGIHCFTPSASPTMKWIAVATRRPESVFRHIEIYDLESKSFFQVTNHTAPWIHHYNPFVSYDSTLVGYHKCRGGVVQDQRFSSMYEDIPVSLLKRRAQGDDQSLTVPRVDYIRSPFPQLSLIRVDGSFPSFSPDGSLIAYIPNLSESGVNVMQLNGSGSTEVYSKPAFGTVWDSMREGVIYTSSGPIFASEESTVHIVAIFNAHRLANGEDIPLVSKILTKEGTKNNAFPSPSPDGKYVVFRSGRSGSKNLYIMDAVQGEEGGLWRLTDGEWTDTMCSWSPDGQWISFSSDRDNPGSESFALYLVHPNGTGLHKLFNHSQVGGRVNHASFSPDSKNLLFTTDYAGVSAEPISVSQQFQPYGEIFVSSLDGICLKRLTHNTYEDGTPAWGKKFISAPDLSREGEGLQCSFDDVDWLTDGITTKLPTPYGMLTQLLCSNIG